MRKTFVSAILALLITTPALAARRALVIGNADYTTTGLETLVTPVNDARGIAALLATMNFASVTARFDLKKKDLEDEIEAFNASLAEGDTALFYYSGHGIQVSEKNFLWPVDLAAVDETQIENDFVPIQSVYDGMKAKKTAINIVILDACRDNPFFSSTHIPGLALPRDTPDSAFIAYATKENRIALATPVGPNNNSPYTHALLGQIGRTGVPIGDIFADVRRIFDAVTGQIPVVENTLNQVFFFREPVSIEARIAGADDDVLVILDGVERLSHRFNGSNVREIKLHGGDNRFDLKVYNHRSFTGGIELFGGRKPEGWNYTADFKHGARTLIDLGDGEDIVEKDGPRHGRLFTAATFTVRVDDGTGAIEVRDENPHAFAQSGIPVPAPDGVLTAAIVTDLKFAAANRGNPDCPQQYFPHLDCLFTGANRSCLIARASALARSGSCDAAFELALTTQCHNESARKEMRRAGPPAVCAWLSQH